MIDELVPTGKEIKANASKKNGLCRFCRPGKGCNRFGNRAPRVDKYKSQRRGR